MMVINRGASNTVVLTLTEKTTLTNPVYLFHLKSDQLKTEYNFIASDSSSFPDRYNEFTITEKASPDTLNGEIELPISGFYHYTIYEQSSATNLDPDNATGIVESGKCQVIATTTSPKAYNPSSTNKAYNG